ncbi:MAG: 2-oxoglutarate and iron-dependent oxygenase domain-containing protein, partial [Inhella sp.]
MEVQVVDYRAPDAARRFTQSLHETGFGVLTNHPIPQHLVERIYATWLDFFNGDEKQRYAFSQETQDGWFSPQVSETAKGATQKDIKEYFHVYPWGRIPPQLRDDALAYYAQANALAAELLGWVEQYTPPE